VARLDNATHGRGVLKTASKKVLINTSNSRKIGDVLGLVVSPKVGPHASIDTKLEDSEESMIAPAMTIIVSRGFSRATTKARTDSKRARRVSLEDVVSSAAPYIAMG